MLLSLLVLACSSNPAAYTETRLEEDGVHVRLTLIDLDSVEIAGNTLSHGEDVVLPLSLFHIGENHLPIQGEGLVDRTLYFKLSPAQALELSCSGEGDGSVSIRAQDEAQGGGTRATGCALADGGFVAASLDAHNGSVIELDGKAVQGTLLLDARAGLWEHPLSAFKEGAAYSSAKKYEQSISVRHADGSEWLGVVEYQDREGDLMGAFLAGLPESTQGMPPGDQVALRWELGWYFTGEGTLGEISRFARVVQESEPRFIRSCPYVDRGAGRVDIDTFAVDRTIAVVDRQGKELGRAQFKAKTQGYRCNDVQYRSNEKSLLLPDPQDILLWAKAL